jgi:superoxide reductase
MQTLGSQIQTADWKSEKHVPVIECSEQVKAGDYFKVTLTLGKAIAHPNTTEHHIRWMALFFQPEGEKALCQIGHFEFCAHGESAKGANESTVYTSHEVVTAMKTSKPGVLHALALCNIHGLWQSSKTISVG